MITDSEESRKAAEEFRKHIRPVATNPASWTERQKLDYLRSCAVPDDEKQEMKKGWGLSV